MAFCGNCGKKLPDGAKVCPFCGAHVEDDMTANQSNAEVGPGEENSSDQAKQPVGPMDVSQDQQSKSNTSSDQQVKSGFGQENQQLGNGYRQQNQQFNNGYGQQNQQFNNGYSQQNQQFNSAYGQGPYQQGPSKASQTLNYMGANMNRLVPKSKSEGLEVACFVMAVLSIKFSLGLIGQASNIAGLVLGCIAMVLLLVNKENTSNKTVQTLGLILSISGIVLSVVGIILVAAHVPELLVAQYLMKKASSLEELFSNFDY